jgi:hypothetical protein
VTITTGKPWRWSRKPHEMPSNCTTVTNNQQFLSQRNTASGLDWIGKFMSHALHLLFFLQVRNTHKMQLSTYQADTNQGCSPPAKNLTGGEHRTAFRGSNDPSRPLFPSKLPKV